MKSYTPPETVPARHGAAALYKNVVRAKGTARRNNGLMLGPTVVLGLVVRLRHIRRH